MRHRSEDPLSKSEGVDAFGVNINLELSPGSKTVSILYDTGRLGDNILTNTETERQIAYASVVLNDRSHLLLDLDVAFPSRLHITRISTETRCTSISWELLFNVVSEEEITGGVDGCESGHERCDLSSAEIGAASLEYDRKAAPFDAVPSELLNTIVFMAAGFDVEEEPAQGFQSYVFVRIYSLY